MQMTHEKILAPSKRDDPGSAIWQSTQAHGTYSHPEANACSADMLSDYPERDKAGIESIVTNIAALAKAQQTSIALDDAVQEWDRMFLAVEERLRLAVGKVLVAAPALGPQSAAELVQTTVLECVMALVKLHEALTLERGQREQMELQKDDAKVMLAMSLALAHGPTDNFERCVSTP